MLWTVYCLRLFMPAVLLGNTVSAEAVTRVVRDGAFVSDGSPPSGTHPRETCAPAPVRLHEARRGCARKTLRKNSDH